jgi:Ni,Fe-hydrogenase maturation factor
VASPPDVVLPRLHHHSAHCPRIDLITVSIARMQPMTMDLSPALEKPLPEVVRVVQELLRDRLAK